VRGLLSPMPLVYVGAIPRHANENEDERGNERQAPRTGSERVGGGWSEKVVRCPARRAWHDGLTDIECRALVARTSEGGRVVGKRGLRRGERGLGGQ
jgi:hypothetical protein